jgi:hypothetical protein
MDLPIPDVVTQPIGSQTPLTSLSKILFAKGLIASLASSLH